MTGILIVTHADLGRSLIDTASLILGRELEKLVSISIDIKEDPDHLRKKIKQAITKVNDGNGVILLTDMFGGTPSNLSYSFLEEGRIEVLSGVNLPILIRAASARKTQHLTELAASLEAFGKKSISLASGILKGNKRG